MRQGWGVWIQKPKTERAGSVSGVLCETAVKNDEQGWWGAAGMAVVVVVVVVVVRPSR